jgi:multidrug resistance efflux pump
MARQKSVILTPAEKKAALKNAKEDLKAAKATAKAAQSAVKLAQAAFKKEIKELEKAFTVASGVAQRIQRQIEGLAATNA